MFSTRDFFPYNLNFDHMHKIFDQKLSFYQTLTVLPGSISPKSMNNNELYKSSEKLFVLPPVENDSISESQLAVARVEKQLEEVGFIASEH